MAGLRFGRARSAIAWTSGVNHNLEASETVYMMTLVPTQDRTWKHLVQIRTGPLGHSTSRLHTPGGGR